MEEKELTGAALHQAFKDAVPGAAGLDAWALEDLRQVTIWQPRCWNLLASFLHKVERTGKWPDALLDGFVALTVKDPSSSGPGPLDQRGLGILSYIYR